MQNILWVVVHFQDRFNLVIDLLKVNKPLFRDTKNGISKNILLDDLVRSKENDYARMLKSQTYKQICPVSSVG